MKKNMHKLINFTVILLVVIGIILPHMNFQFVLNHTFTIQLIAKITVLIIALIVVILSMWKGLNLKLRNFEIVLLVFALYILFSHLFTSSNTNSDSIVPKVIYSIVFYFTLKFLIENFEINVYNILRYTILIIFSIEFFFIISQNFGLIKNANPLFEIGGSFGHPGYTSMYIALLSVFLSSNYKQLAINLKWKYIVATLIIFSFLFSIIVKSRIGILINASSIILYLMALSKNNSHKNGKIIILLIITAIMLSQVKIDSTNGRLFIWKNSIELMKNLPAFGFGIDSFPSIYNKKQMNYFSTTVGNEEERLLSDYVTIPYNDFIKIILETGFLGGILLISFLIYTILNERVSDKKIQIFFFTFAIFLIMCFWNIIGELPYMLLFFSILALCNNKVFLENTKDQSKYLKIISGGTLCCLIFYCSKDLYSKYQFIKNKTLAEKSMNKGDFTQAVMYYNYAINFSTTQDIIIPYTLALKNSKDVKSAIKFLEESLNLYYSPDHLLLLGDLYFSQASYTSALKYYFAAHHNVPSKFTPLYKIAKSYIYDNRRIEADSIINILIHSNPKVNSASVILMKEELKYLQKKIK